MGLFPLNTEEVYHSIVRGFHWHDWGRRRAESPHWKDNESVAKFFFPWPWLSFCNKNSACPAVVDPGCMFGDKPLWLRQTMQNYSEATPGTHASLNILSHRTHQLDSCPQHWFWINGTFCKTPQVGVPHTRNHLCEWTHNIIQRTPTPFQPIRTAPCTGMPHEPSHQSKSGQ